MISSMTAFAKVQSQDEIGSINIEMRSVNSRFLDVSFRLPESLRMLEVAFRARLKNALERGKIDITLKFQAGEALETPLEINHRLLKQIQSASIALRAELTGEFRWNITRVLRWPGLLQEGEVDLSRVEALALPLFDNALDALKEMRHREGESLAQLMLQRLTEIENEVAKLKAVLPELVGAQQERLKTRFENFKNDIDQERLAQELVYLAQKSDVAEEIDRLDTHVIEIKRLINAGGVLGRRLDFLVQELHREANTLGSKSCHQTMTDVAINLKVLIEQIREQVQNLE
jgi:uncharacterized protein (TIGR00255 family)